MKGHDAASLTAVGDKVFAWIQPDGSWWINNAGAIATDDGVLLVDTCATDGRTRALLAAVSDATDDAPIVFAVNTHMHGDHTYGNSLLPEATIIVGHDNTRDGVLNDTVIDGCPPFWQPVPDWGDVTRRAPTLTTSTDITLHLGDQTIELVHPGYPAHTSGDLVVWLPGQRVLFTGDLLFHRVTPLVFMGSVDGALSALDWIAQFEPAYVVPGHGPLIDSDILPGVLDEHRRYYRLVVAAADAGLFHGLDPLAAARNYPLDSFAGLPDAERFVLNLHRVYADRRATDVDILAAFSDAVAFNGGPMHTAV